MKFLICKFFIPVNFIFCSGFYTKLILLPIRILHNGEPLVKNYMTNIPNVYLFPHVRKSNFRIEGCRFTSASFHFLLLGTCELCFFQYVRNAKFMHCHAAAFCIFGPSVVQMQLQYYYWSLWTSWSCFLNVSNPRIVSTIASHLWCQNYFLQLIQSNGISLLLFICSGWVWGIQHIWEFLLKIYPFRLS